MTLNLPDPTSRRVIILTGPHAGHEGICLGASSDESKWMISPDDSNDILAMVFDKDFGILISSDD